MTVILAAKMKSTTGCSTCSGCVIKGTAVLPHSAVSKRGRCQKSDGQQTCPEVAFIVNHNAVDPVLDPPGFKQSAPGVSGCYSAFPSALAGPVAIEKAAFQGWCLRLKTEDESLTRRKRLMTPLSETGKGRSHGLLITKSGVHSHH